MKDKLTKLNKCYLNCNVFEAAQERISYVFDEFEKIYISFSGGKDSSVMFHLIMNEAKKRNRKVGVLFIDWECQFEGTIQHIRDLFNEYNDYIVKYWVQLEILTNNATSMIEPLWKSWDESKKDLWTREKEQDSIKDKSYFPFYFDGITFEEFVPLFAKWYSDGEKTTCFVGIRSQESLNRFRVFMRENINRYNDKKYSTCVMDNVYNFYPIYDFKTTDIWHYNYKYKKKYNKIYDYMHMAGLTINQMRIDEPFGDEARKNLWLYQIIEPKTWTKIVARMHGVNSGALYSQENGNVLGNLKISLPDGHNWESFSKFILETMPPKTADHYKNKIAKYIQWYKERGYENGIPDYGDYRLEQLGKIPAWRQVAKTLLRNDYWCRNLGFSITKSSNYTKYLELMKRKRQEWNLFNN
jgi:predicted phosphoadenosine phosphosulfate sulfurtransferase